MTLVLQDCQRQPLVSLKQALQPLHGIVPELDQMFQIVQVRDRQDDDNDSLSLDQSASIRLYTLQRRSSQFSFGYLLDRILDLQTYPQVLPWFLYLRLFFDALSKLPSNTVSRLYRAMEIDTRDVYNKGDEVTWPNFVSCTSSRDFVDARIGDNQSFVIFSIKCNSAKDIRRYSGGSIADEFLLCPGQTFKVMGSSPHGNHSKLVQLEEILQSDRNTEPTARQSSEQYIRTFIAHELIRKRSSTLLLPRLAMIAADVSLLDNPLKRNTTLKFLSFAYNHLSDQGIQSLMKILSENDTKIEILSLHATGLTDQSLKDLTKMLKKNTTLTWLHLGRNQISDQSIHLLTDVLIHYNQTLKALDLSHNELITDVSVDALVKMISINQTLETLWIRQCPISKKGQTILQKAVQATRRFYILCVK